MYLAPCSTMKNGTQHLKARATLGRAVRLELCTVLLLQRVLVVFHHVSVCIDICTMHVVGSMVWLHASQVEFREDGAVRSKGKT